MGTTKIPSSVTLLSLFKAGGIFGGCTLSGLQKQLPWRRLLTPFLDRFLLAIPQAGKKQEEEKIKLK